MNGGIYCQDVTFTVTDNNLASVTVNGQTVTDYTLKAGSAYTVVAADGAGNSTTVTVTVNTGHSYEATVTKEPTRTEEGETTYTCTVCGQSYTETIPATGSTPSSTESGSGDSSSECSSSDSSSDSSYSGTPSSVSSAATGDSSPVMLWFTLLLTSGGGVLALICHGKKWKCSK